MSSGTARPFMHPLCGVSPMHTTGKAASQGRR